MGQPGDLEVDVCVIGGGPAGCTFAMKMARLGHRVCLVDRAKPRPRVGESLSPGVSLLLETVGASAALRTAGARPMSAIRVTWEGAERVRHDGGARGHTVDRNRFDAALREHARAHGVHVLAPAVARRPARSDGAWSVAVDHGGGDRRRIRARFLADASGRERVSRGRRTWTAARTLCVYGLYRATSDSAPGIRAGREGWYWRVPLADDTVEQLAFVAAARIRSAHASDILAAGGLLETSATGALGPIRVTDATPYVDESCASHTSIKIGDAAVAIDPLSSSGVQKAVQAALSGAIVANTLLRVPASREAALSFHRDGTAATSVQHARWAAEQYGLVASARGAELDAFWRDRADAAVSEERAAPRPTAPRALAEMPVALCPRAAIVATPCIDGELITVQRAVMHPSLERPCAYVGGVALVPLLADLRDGMTPLELARRWTARELPPKRTLAIAGWLVRCGILVEARG